MSTHTPGPWMVEKSGTKRIDHLNIVHTNRHGVGGPSLVLAKVTCRVSWQKEQEANASLIAAAPSMLAALRFLDVTGGLTMEQGMFVSRAILEAEGNLVP